MITQAKLKQILDYDPLSGLFTWRYRHDKSPCTNNRDTGRVAGTKRAGKYVGIRIDDVLYGAHNLAYLYMTGCWPDEIVDHKNGIKSDNRWDNLRPATYKQNGYNAAVKSNNTSGHKGVSWDKNNNKWLASIMVDRKTKFLGRYIELDDAVKARKEAEEKYFGEYSVHQR